MAKAVVSTTVGAEGLPVTSGRDIVIADEPARFAHAVVHLMRDTEARRAIEAAARTLVVRTLRLVGGRIRFRRRLAESRRHHDRRTRYRVTVADLRGPPHRL